jgi:peptide/nickel transport system substrate-binding protein
MVIRLLAMAFALIIGRVGPAMHEQLVVAQTAEPGSLDPLLLTGTPAEEIGSLVYSYLVQIDDRGRLVPDLALRVPSQANGDIARDGRTIVYHLRHDVRWHDGVRFTARDVIATYRAVMDARNPVPTRLGFDQVQAIDALDDETIRVRLRAPFAPFLTYFFETENYPILPAHVLARTGSLVASTLSTAPIGTGPYIVTRWKHGDALELAANSRYFGGTPKIERLVLRFVGNAQTIVELLQTGEADAYLAADPAFVDRLRANPRLRVTTVPIYGFEALAMQTSDRALRDPRVRRAIAHAFDVARDLRRTAHGALRTADAGRALFTTAYVPQRITPGDPRLLPVHLTLAVDASRSLERELAVQFQDEVRDAGLDLEIVPYAPQQFLAPLSERGPIESGRYQLALVPILTGADPETSWLLACNQIPPEGFNITRYCNPAVDRALRDALGTFDQARRNRDYAIVQAAIARDVPLVMLWQTREVEALPARLHGFTGSPETPWYGVERWSL